MNNELRWTVDELLVRYELEPDLLDVFVEGRLDREILSQHRAGGCSGRTFYEIDAVDIPEEMVRGHGLTLGNKQRVISLSIELSKAPESARVTCLADKDLDHWFCGTDNTHRLHWSLFCSIESHFLTRETIFDIAITTGKSKISDVDLFIHSLENALRQLYALRLADRELHLNIKWIALRKYISKSGDQVIFDIVKYSHAALSSSRALNQKENFLDSVNSWLERLNCDIRHASRGHDYTDVLAWAIGEFGGQKEFSSPEAVQRLFVLLSRSVHSLGSELQ